jgi:hypothetical protein
MYIGVEKYIVTKVGGDDELRCAGEWLRDWSEF